MGAGPVRTAPGSSEVPVVAAFGRCDCPVAVRLALGMGLGLVLAVELWLAKGAVPRGLGARRDLALTWSPGPAVAAWAYEGG